MVTTAFLFTEYRKRILGLLLLHPDSQYHVREIARLTKTTAGTLHRELSKLAEAQVLLREISGKQVLYQANVNYPLYQELKSILKKTSGLMEVLEEALQAFKDKIKAAFIYGSVASGKETLGSDIDVIIIGEIMFSDAVKALYSSQALLKREINPKVYKQSEWNDLLNKKNNFVKEVIKKPKIFIVGDINDLR